jgi:hypothetical protein
MYTGTSAFAFDSEGSLLAGWPIVDLCCYFTGRVVGDELRLFAPQPLGDALVPGEPFKNGLLVTITGDGELRRGVEVPMFETRGSGAGWAVGPDGIAYGAMNPSPEPQPAGESELAAIGGDGLRAGWPAKIDGLASEPAFGPDGRIVVTVGSAVTQANRVLVFDSDGQAVSASSADLPIATGELPADCSGVSPQRPIVEPTGAVRTY